MPRISSSPSERAETKIIHITVLHTDYSHNAKDIFFSIRKSRNKDYSHNCVTYR